MNPAPSSEPLFEGDLTHPSDSAGSSSGKKWLLGCGCGCLVLLLMVIGGLGFLYNWFMAEGDQLPADHVLGSETVLALHMDSPAEDLATRRFLGTLVKSLGNMQIEGLSEEELEEFQRSFQELQQLDLDEVAEVAGYLPSAMTLAYEDDGSELQRVFAMNLPHGSKVVRYLVESTAGDGTEVHPIGEFEAYDFVTTVEEDGVSTQTSTGQYVAFQHDTLLAGTSLEILQKVLERTAYDEEPGPAPDSPLREELEAKRKLWLLAGALRPSERLDLAAMLRDLLPSPDEEQLAAGDFPEVPDLEWTTVDFELASFGLGLTGEDLGLRIEVKGLATEDLDEVQTGLERYADAIAQHLARYDLEWNHEVLRGPDSLALNATSPEFRSWVEAKLQAAAAEAAEESAAAEDLLPVE